MPEPYFRWGCVVVSSCAIGLECAGDEEGEGCGSFVGKGGRAQEREIVSVAPQGLLGRLRRLCPARLVGPAAARVGELVSGLRHGARDVHQSARPVMQRPRRRTHLGLRFGSDAPRPIEGYRSERPLLGVFLRAADGQCHGVLLVGGDLQCDDYDNCAGGGGCFGCLLLRAELSGDCRSGRASVPRDRRSACGSYHAHGPRTVQHLGGRCPGFGFRNTPYGACCRICRLFCSGYGGGCLLASAIRTRALCSDGSAATQGGIAGSSSWSALFRPVPHHRRLRGSVRISSTWYL